MTTRRTRHTIDYPSALLPGRRTGDHPADHIYTRRHFASREEALKAAHDAAPDSYSGGVFVYEETIGAKYANLWERTSEVTIVTEDGVEVREDPL